LSLPFGGKFAEFVYNTFKLFGARVNVVVSVEIMKLRMIKLTPEFLMKALQGKIAASISNLPEDAELLDIKYDVFSKQVLAVVRSSSFEDVPESYPIPEFNVTTSAKPQTATQPTVAVNLDPKPAAVLKIEPAPVKKPQAQPAKPTGKIENEFSPEHRKLLSFKVEGETVVVKPIQFLKEEWEDINEVVRSLGGKWVKGDIISYWAIPLQQG
jgi:hypothetical protein